MNVIYRWLGDTFDGYEWPYVIYFGAGGAGYWQHRWFAWLFLAAALVGVVVCREKVLKARLAPA